MHVAKWGNSLRPVPKRESLGRRRARGGAFVVKAMGLEFNPAQFRRIAEFKSAEVTYS